MGYYRIVSDENRDLVNTDSVKNFFVRRDFLSVEDEIKKISDKENRNINKALIYHVLGKYVEANRYYEKLKGNDIGCINYFACCHRYFDYSKLNTTYLIENKYELALYNNYFNYLVATKGIEEVDNTDVKHTIFTEQIVNDLYYKIGRPVLHEQNDVLKKQYLDNIEIQEKKVVTNKKRKVGMFVTDIQRHKDSAIIYELVECLKEKYDIIIYFNNIFANKLIKMFEGICTVRYVVNMYFEEINNIIYDDEIDLLIDFAELGLRNNNLALSLVKNCISLHELLFLFPILLETDLYYSYKSSGNKEDITCVIGDFRCLTDDELIRINKKISGTIVFESHALDEKIFMDFFKKKIKSLGYNMDRVVLKPGILPFSKYMNYLSVCKNIVISSGASYVELSEAIKCGANILVMSDNSLIKKTYGIYFGKKEKKESYSEENKKELLRFISETVGTERYRIKNKKSRIAYFEKEKEMTISNTCNGDIIILGE